MAFFNKYPYTDMHELNLDWILETIRNLCQEMDDWEAVNAITFSGAWDITKQYPSWTIVSDNNIGYVSIKPVPAGILLTDGNYWRAVIDYTAQIAGLQTRVVNIENDIDNNIKPDIEYVKKSEYVVINVVEYGIDNTGNNPVSDDLNTLINDNPGACFFFENGTYLIDDTIILNTSCKIIMSPKTILKVVSTISSVFIMDNDGNREDYPDVFGMKKIDIEGGIIDCNKNADIAIEVNATYKSLIHNIKIRDFNQIGIKVNNVGGAGLLVNNTLIWGYGTAGSYGIYDIGNDNLYENVTVVDCVTGFHNVDSNLYACTAWLSKPEYYPGSVCFYNSSRTQYTNCIADTYETAWLGNTNSNTFIINGSVINNNGVITPNTNTYIFGNSNSYFYYNNLVSMLSDATFAYYPNNVSGINYVAAASYPNAPTLTRFNQLTIASQSSVNIDATVISTLLTNLNRNGYFVANAITGSPAGWGNIEVVRTSNCIMQRVSIAGYATKARISTDNGSTWSAWT